MNSERQAVEFIEFDVSSFGETLEDARRSLLEAVQAFIEECKAMGTLEGVPGG